MWQFPHCQDKNKTIKHKQKKKERVKEHTWKNICTIFTKYDYSLYIKTSKNREKKANSGNNGSLPKS